MDNKGLADVLVGCAQLLDTIKGEWGASWSEWDQSIRDGISSQLEILYVPEACRCGQGFTVTCPVHGKPTPELEPGEFFITRGDGVQERCRYVPDKTEKL